MHQAHLFASEVNGNRGHDVQRIANALARRKRISIRVNTSGMLPFVRPGDIAMIREAAIDELEPGDLLLLKLGSHLRARRLPQEVAHDKIAEFISELDGDSASRDGGEVELLGCIVHLQRGDHMINLRQPSNKDNGGSGLAKPFRRFFQVLRPF